MKWLWQVREWNCITLLEFDKVFKRGVEINSAQNQKFKTKAFGNFAVGEKKLG